MANITLKQLAYFKAAAETGSVADAAKRENLTQPSISSALLKMEATLGVSLFVRHHAQGVSLTPTGLRLLPLARALLRQADEFEDLGRSEAEEPVGNLKIGCYPTLAPTFMPAVIETFRKDYPRIELEFVEGTEDDILPKMEAGEIDAGIFYDTCLPDNVKRVTLQTLEPHVLLSAGHRMAGRKEIDLAEIAEEPLILLDTKPGREYFLQVLAAADLKPNIYFRSPSFEVIRGLVGRGLGYSILVTKPRSQMTYDGLPLVHVPVKKPVPNTSVCLVRMPTFTTTKAVAILQETCRAISRAL
ncbi:LysR family transcriptional regulator [Methyloligella sp. 2.7D]|uniref:LysR family transcriptional regulator n=1 Tax=unclassified Methyloligella TaxID=2625955 RepID=UPI00157D491C|nr:LysR family transcriptional regulator [Methyloligella sp. GL2]QKP76668.1 LysR family transcriptional regulator [Methyloligella sp. GL2]